MKPALVLAAALLAVPLNTITSAPVGAVAVQGDHLPGIDASGASLPLKPGQLMAEERATFAKLTPGSDDARRFLFVRGFLRYAELVVANKLEPSLLPDLPKREDWDGAKFFSKAERATVDAALGRKIIAGMKTDLPPPLELTLLKPDQLDPEERKSFAQLAVGSDDARRFLHTRSFLRPCRKVLDRTLQPALLPDLPKREDWDRKFLSATESKEIVDVCLAMSMMAAMK